MKFLNLDKIDKDYIGHGDITRALGITLAAVIVIPLVC